MSYAYAMSPCICCKRPFVYNPLRVPSTSAITGQREPICETCIGLINEKRKGAGLEPFAIHSDAYEAIAEEELP
jgi:hypothetical protein